MRFGRFDGQRLIVFVASNAGDAVMPANAVNARLDGEWDLATDSSRLFIWDARQLIWREAPATGEGAMHVVLYDDDGNALAVRNAADGSTRLVVDDVDTHNRLDSLEELLLRLLIIVERFALMNEV